MRLNHVLSAEVILITVAMENVVMMVVAEVKFVSRDIFLL
jgi:hypothetical protein